MQGVSTGHLFIATWFLWFSTLHTYAATIVVDDSSGAIGGPGCTLRDALRSANTDAVSGGCTAGDGADTIELPSGAFISLTEADNSSEGATGLPAITSEITIQGDGATIQRDSAGAEFRVLYITASGNLTLIDVTVRNGLFQSAISFGGGIFNHGTLALDHCTLSDNGAYAGGGIANFGGTVSIDTSTISDNTARGPSGTGGGIWNRTGGTMTLIDSTVQGNASGGGGAGISNVAALSAQRCTVNANAAGGVGGGIANYAGLLLTNSTISGNSSISAGGGLFTSSTAAVTLSNNTISDNQSRVYGGGVADVSGSVVVSNSVIAANTSGFGGPDFNGLGISEGYNVIGDGTGSAGFDQTGDLVGTAAAPIDPMLDPLADNGGPTLTHALLGGSPAVDAGDCTHGTMTIDQRGVDRPLPAGGFCDVGAFEYEGEVSATVPIAMCQDLTTYADSSCTALVSAEAVNNGSSVDEALCGSPALHLEPAGPYPAGSTEVTLWVSDACGQSDACDATITVIDISSPAISCPANIETDAFTINGAPVVIGPASAFDNCPGVAVDCDRIAGGIYPIGTTVLACTASDASENQASCAFSVHVRSPEEMVENVIDQVQQLRDSGNLSPGQANSLIKKAALILGRIRRGQTKASCNQLAAFVNEVKAMIDARLIPRDAGRQLIASAAHARGALDCDQVIGGSAPKVPRPTL